MNYEEKYKQALERAKKELRVCGSQDCDAARQIFRFFPELENEDERIRKGLINGFKECLEDCKYPKNAVKYWHDVEVDNILAWLERQGEKLDEDELVKGVLRRTAISFMNWLNENTPEDKMCLSNMECEDIDNAVYNGDWNRVYAYIKKKLEKRGEQKQDPCEHCKDKCLNCHNFPCIDKRTFEQGKSIFDIMFHEGDWIIFNGSILHIDEVVNGYYRTTSIGGIVNSYDWGIDYAARFWTIKDAKDGDVLVASDSSIFLFAGVDDCACKYYVALTTDNYLKINKEPKGGYWETSRAVYPATKEQRDLLFKKMYEAGYEWDADKKELKKI